MPGVAHGEPKSLSAAIAAYTAAHGQGAYEPPARLARTPASRPHLGEST